MNTEELAGRAPVNKQAGMLFAKGEHYEPTLGNYNFIYKDIPPMKEIPAHTLPDPGFINLTGRKIGRLTVIGMSIKPSRWVCRCLCGNYIIRQSKTLRKPESELHGSGLMCDECSHLEDLKQGKVPKRSVL